MKLKKEYLLLLLAIVGLSAYLLMRSEDQRHFELPKLAQVESDQIDRMVVRKGERIVELQKKDDQWVVGPEAYKCDSIKVKNMPGAHGSAYLCRFARQTRSLSCPRQHRRHL